MMPPVHFRTREASVADDVADDMDDQRPSVLPVLGTSGCGVRIVASAEPAPAGLRSILRRNGQEEVSSRGSLNRVRAHPGPERVACPDCGLLQLIPLARRPCVSECRRCGRVLAGPATGRIDAPLAWCLAALLLLLPACAAPMMSVSSYGAFRQTWFPGAPGALWQDGFPSLALLVSAFSIVLTVSFLALLVWVLGSLHFGRRDSLGTAFRCVTRLRPWVMTEVYLVGCFVAYSRIKVVATVDVGVGGWFLIAATLALLLAMTQLDERTVWQSLEPRDVGDAAAPPEGPLVACRVCDLVVGKRFAASVRCPRCQAKLHRRKPDSMRRTASLVVAGYILYIPANVLPVLTVVRFGREDPNTILSGVLELIRNHLWPLALIVFAASIVLPLMKLLGLSWMLIATRRGTRRFLLGRTRLYRMIDMVGRWSNIDVFMVSVLVAILQFGAVTEVHAGNGLVAFAAVVVLTMIATEVFDARLMWDRAGDVHG